MADPIESYLDETARFLCGVHLIEQEEGDEEIDLEYEEVLDTMTTVGATMRSGRITSYPKEGIEGIGTDVFNRTDAEQLAKITSTFYDVWDNFRPGGRTQEAVNQYGQLRFEIEELRSRRGDLDDWADDVVDEVEGADPDDDRAEMVGDLLNWMEGFKALIDNVDMFGVAVANRGLLRGDEEPEEEGEGEEPPEGEEEVEESFGRRLGSVLLEASGPEIHRVTGTDSVKAVFDDGTVYVYDTPLQFAPRSRNSVYKIRDWVEGWDKQAFDDHEDWSLQETSESVEMREARGQGADREEVIAWMRNQILKLDKGGRFEGFTVKEILKDRDAFGRVIGAILSDHEGHIWADGSDHPIARYVNDHNWSKLVADAHKSLQRRVSRAADRGQDWDDLGVDIDDLI